MKQFNAKVLSNSAIARDYYRMRFEWANEAEEPLPGQFVSIRSFGTTDLILRRPFAVSSFDPAQATAEIIYQKRGKATHMLAGTNEGEHLDFIGPLGNFFPAEERAHVVLIGGGVGLGPILFSGKRLSSSGRPATVVLGFRDKSFVPSFLEDEQSLGFKPIVCTDDGSLGFHGTTVGWLEQSQASLDGAVVFACGPNPMMAGCSRFCDERGITCWVSMEQIMACGVGACMGCAIPVAGESPYARVCTEGPVFDARRVQWEQLT